jgi:CheY-like chemotaxis protein
MDGDEKPVSAVGGIEVAVGLLLIVEDDPDTRSTMTLLLAEAGYSVCEAADVAGGVGKLRGLRPDVVLLDYGLPDPSDGEAFLQEKATDPDVSSIPVVLMSGFNLPSHVEGAVAVIQKPFDFEPLLALIQRLIGPPQKPNSAAVA